MNQYEYDYDYDTLEVTGMKHDSLIDVSVLILFFNRPEQLRKVFYRVREARPSRLFLYQDGARSGNENDERNIQACRDVVTNVDWNCTLYRLFQKKNYGCDPSEYISQKWAFSISDKCIVLEDDDVPSVSFFRYCKELLDLYENDKRIYRICGSNVLGKYCPYNGDYFFTRGGNISGWASWKRVIDEWDPEYSFMKDNNIINCLNYTYKDAGAPIPRFLKNCKKHINSNREHYESIFAATRYLQSGLTIIPSVNMISNIGITPDATHGGKDIHLLSRNLRKFFNSETYDIVFPMKHPQYILEDRHYEIAQSKLMGWKKSLFRKITDKIGSKYRKIRYSK